jgi:hypothetical protein
VDAVAAVIFFVAIASAFAYPTVSKKRLQAKMRKAPSGSLQTVDTRPGNVDTTIQWWGKAGYDLHERSEWTGPAVGRSPQVVIHVILVFVKR